MGDMSRTKAPIGVTPHGWEADLGEDHTSPLMWEPIQSTDVGQQPETAADLGLGSPELSLSPVQILLGLSAILIVVGGAMVGLGHWLKRRDSKGQD